MQMRKKGDIAAKLMKEYDRGGLGKYQQRCTVTAMLWSCGGVCKIEIIEMKHLINY